MIWFLTFFLSLPVSVWLLATLLSVLDQRPRSVPLIRLGIAACLVVLFLILARADLWTAIASAFTFVTLSHLASGWAFRHLALSAKVHDSFAPDDDA